MTRLGIGLLTLTTAILVLDGAEQRSERVQSTPPPEVLFDAAWASREVARVNPSLSPDELRRIGVAVMRNSEHYGVDPDLVIAVIKVESTARPWAVSHAGALGLMQVMPKTARFFAKKHLPQLKSPHRKLRDPHTNLKIGTRLLAQLLKRYKGDELKALIA